MLAGNFDVAQANRNKKNVATIAQNLQNKDESKEIEGSSNEQLANLDNAEQQTGASQGDVPEDGGAPGGTDGLA